VAQPTRPVVTCLTCGGVFSRLSNKGPAPKRCRPCSTQRSRYEALDHQCRECGVEVVRRIVNGPFPEFCPPCKRERRKQQNKALHARRSAAYEAKGHSCIDCGTATSRAYRGGPFPKRCAACNEKWRQESHRAYTVMLAERRKLRTCRDCQTEFTWWADNWTLRCQPCHEDWRADLRRSKNKARRIRLVGVEYEYISRAVVFDECGWICGLCDQPVDPDLKWPDPRSASLDHIVPLAQGGGHVRANTQLAHYDCNSRKGASPPTIDQA